MLNSGTKFLSWMTAFFLMAMVFFIFEDITSTALKNFSWSFITEEPMSAGRKGGILPIITSTLLILLVCISVVFPVGIGTALFLSEFSHDYPKFIFIIRKSIEVLAGVPSIVFGLFGNAIFSVYLGMGFSILSGGLTLAVMALPLFIKTVEEGIRFLPQTYRMVPFSLGLSHTTTIFSVLLPAAIPSIAVGLALSIGRALAETAALIFTSGYVDRMPESVFDSGRSLSIHLYDLAMNVPGGNTNAYKTAFVLILLIVITNGVFNSLCQFWYKKKVSI